MQYILINIAEKTRCIISVNELVITSINSFRMKHGYIMRPPRRVRVSASRRKLLLRMRKTRGNGLWQFAARHFDVWRFGRQEGNVAFIVGGFGFIWKERRDISFWPLVISTFLRPVRRNRRFFIAVVSFGAMDCAAAGHFLLTIGIYCLEIWLGC